MTSNRSTRKWNYSLVDLLVVVSILAIVSGAVTVFYSGVREKNALSIMRADMLEIKKAILKFKEDTGYFPKEGPFAADNIGYNIANFPSGLTLTADKESWLNSPANFVQLFISPVDSSDNEIMPWDVDNKRGWNGPYISKGNLVYLTARAGTSLVDPLATKLTFLYALSDKYIHDFSTHVNDILNIYPLNDNTNAYEEYGRPYILLDIGDKDDMRLIGAGPDGDFSTSSDNLILYIY